MTQNQRFRKWIMTSLAFLILISTAIGSLSLIWMRQQTTHIARKCRNLEMDLHKLEVKCTFLSAKIAEMHNPQYLLSQVKDGFRRPSKEQVIGDTNILRPQLRPMLALRGSYISPASVR